MTRLFRFNDVEHAVSAAMQDHDIQQKGGFVVVHWQEWFYWLATGEPEASLETIMGTSTSGVIVERYRYTDAGWQQVYERASDDD